MMQVLVTLTKASGTTVARSELIDRCWGGLVVSTDALNRVIARLRHQLVDAGGGFAIETLPRIGYRLAAADPPDVQHAGAVAAELAINPLALGEQLQELYRRAQHGLEQPSREQLELAAGMLQEVTERLPHDSLGWAGLAEAQRLLLLYLPPDLQEPARVTAWRTAERALALDPATGDALATIADLIPRFGNWSEIEQRIEAGLKLAPHSERLQLVKAQFLASIGRTAESADLFATLLAANPLSARITIGAAGAMFDIGHTDEALIVIEAAHRRWPSLMLVWSECVRLNVAACDFDRGRKLLDAPPTSVSPEDPNLARRRLHLIAMRDKRPTDIAAAIANFTAFAEIGLVPAVVAIYALATLGSIHAALTIAETIC
jgi:tetratricopeptide (TPR) repeat protein